MVQRFRSSHTLHRARSSGKLYVEKLRQLLSMNILFTGDDVHSLISNCVIGSPLHVLYLQRQISKLARKKSGGKRKHFELHSRLINMIKLGVQRHKHFTRVVAVMTVKKIVYFIARQQCHQKIRTLAIKPVYLRRKGFGLLPLGLNKFQGNVLICYR